MNKLYDRYRYSLILLVQLVKTDFKLRYQGSALGYVWTLLRPLALFVILYIVFAQFLRVGESIPNYPVYLLLGIVFWNYFVEVTTGSVASIVSRVDLIRKLNFPKYVIILAGSFSALINLLINFVIIGVFIVWQGADPSMSALYVLPLLLAELFVFALSLSFLLSALYVKFRDVEYIWEVIMQGAFYATPILYPLSLVPSLAAAKILMLNPMAQIIQGTREVLITPKTTTTSELFDGGPLSLVPIVIVIVVAILSMTYFRNRSPYFAEEA